MWVVGACISVELATSELVNLKDAGKDKPPAISDLLPRHYPREWLLSVHFLIFVQWLRCSKEWDAICHGLFKALSPFSLNLTDSKTKKSCHEMGCGLDGTNFLIFLVFAVSRNPPRYLGLPWYQIEWIERRVWWSRWKDKRMCQKVHSAQDLVVKRYEDDNKVVTLRCDKRGRPCSPITVALLQYHH